jgi:endonuclease/exonuclease/phosphatase family metal-dependent hydrolase
VLLGVVARQLDPPGCPRHQTFVSGFFDYAVVLAPPLGHAHGRLVDDLFNLLKLGRARVQVELRADDLALFGVLFFVRGRQSAASIASITFSLGMPFPPRARPKPSSLPFMRVVNLNTWGGRLPGVPEYLANLNADVLCLQEITSAPAGTPEMGHYIDRDGQPDLQRTNFLRELEQKLCPGYRSYFFPAARGYLHDGAKTEYPVFYGIATFVRNTVPVIGERMGFVFEEYRTANFKEPPLPRNAHAVRVYNHENETSVIVAHMHGLWVPDGKYDTDDRVNQAIRLNNIVGQVHQKRDDKIVVCGDFNVLPKSLTFEMLDTRVPRNLIKEFGITDTRTKYYDKPIETHPRYADYMLVNSHVNVKKFDVPGDPEVSDHRPLILDFD